MRLAVAWVAVALLGAALSAASARGEVKVEKIPYMGLPNCYRLSNGTAEVVVTTDVGPRIIRYAFAAEGAENVLAELPNDVVTTEWGEWKPWGGHRLWLAPEQKPRSYAPDNAPVTMEPVGGNAVRVTAPDDPRTGTRKEMLITLDASGTGVTILHRVTNTGVWAIEAAPWAITIVAGGGMTILPQEPYRSHDDDVLPARPMVLWSYTDFEDPRWTVGKKYIRLRSDERAGTAQKAGAMNKQGWAAYLRKDILFVKRFPYEEGASYPDYGCNCETFTKGSFMEIETLAPLRSIAPGGTAEHTEQWSLARNVRVGTTEASLDAAITPLVGAPALR